MGKQIIDNQWGTSKGNYVYKYHRDFKEKLIADSRITYNPVNGVGELYYNVRTECPINRRWTEKKLGALLKAAFGTSKYICIAGTVNKSNRGDYYCCSIQFHFKSKSIPQNPETIPSIIENNVVAQRFVGVDKETGEAEYYEYNELPYDAHIKRLIVQQCEEPKVTKKGKKASCVGKYWSYYE